MTRTDLDQWFHSLRVEAIDINHAAARRPELFAEDDLCDLDNLARLLAKTAAQLRRRKAA